MKNRLLLFAVFILSLNIFSQPLMVLNFEGDGSDMKCPDRMNKRYNDIANIYQSEPNPLKTAVNPSEKVLKMAFDQTHPNKKWKYGLTYLNLTHMWNFGSTSELAERAGKNELFEFDEVDKIDLSKYDRIRFKYLIQGNFMGSNIKVGFDFVSDHGDNTSTSIVQGVWSNPLENASDWTEWNTVTCKFEKGLDNHSISIRLYDHEYDFDERLLNTFIYIDDIELFDSSEEELTTICAVKDNHRGMLTIVMDDGYPKSSEYYEQQFIANDLRGTTALVTHPLSYLHDSRQYFQDLLTRGRFEYGSHSKTHPESAPKNEDERQSEIVSSKQDLMEWFPNQRILTFTLYNSVKFYDENLELAKSTYEAVRSGERGYNSLQPTIDEMYLLRVQGVLNTETAEKMNAWIDVTTDKRLWLIEMWHAIYEYDPSTYLPPKAEVASAHLKYIGDQQKAGKLWVATFDEAVQYIKERENATITDDGNENLRTITLTDTLDDELFNYPLTLKSEIPSEWEYVQVTQGNNTMQIASVAEEDKNYVYYNVVPDRGDITLSKTTAPGADITELRISASSNNESKVGKPLIFTAATSPHETNNASIEWFVNGVRQFTVGTELSFTPISKGLYGIIAKATSATSGATIYSNILTMTVGDGPSAITDNTGPGITLYTQNNKIYLENSSTEIIKTINGYNVQGELVYTNNHINNNTVVIPHLKNGIYFIKLTTDKGVIIHKVLIN